MGRFGEFYFTSAYSSIYSDGFTFLQGLHYNKTVKVVRWDHYDLRYKTNNMWSFLGNGLTEAQVKKDISRLSPYIRTEDTPFEI